MRGLENSGLSSAKEDLGGCSRAWPEREGQVREAGWTAFKDGV